jgi:AcrR family transcriptional regulator
MTVATPPRAELQADIRLEIKSVPLTPQKEEIIRAASDLIAQYGYDGLSIRELANRSGLATATIYHHFRDKEDIFLHVLEQDAIAVETRCMTIVQSEEPVLAKLRHLIQLHVAMMDENRLTAIANIRRLKTMDKTMPWFMERILPRLLLPLVAVVDQGVQKQVFRPVDGKLTAITILGMMHSLCSFKMAIYGRTLSEALIDHICELVVHGIVQQDRLADSQATPKPGYALETVLHPQSATETEQFRILF